MFKFSPEDIEDIQNVDNEVKFYLKSTSKIIQIIPEGIYREVRYNMHVDPVSIMWRSKNTKKVVEVVDIALLEISSDKGFEEKKEEKRKPRKRKMIRKENNNEASKGISKEMKKIQNKYPGGPLISNPGNSFKVINP